MSTHQNFVMHDNPGMNGNTWDCPLSTTVEYYDETTSSWTDDLNVDWISSVDSTQIVFESTPGVLFANIDTYNRKTFQMRIIHTSTDSDPDNLSTLVMPFSVTWVSECIDDAISF